jgi:fumarate hydratase class I
MAISRSAGLGAQFGGTALALDARVIRLPRHAGSCPVSIGVSCSAHRNALAVIDSGGIRLEAMEKNPTAFLLARGGEAARIAEEFTAQKVGSRPSGSNQTGQAPATLDLDRPMPDLLARLSAYPVGTRLLLSGVLLVARDAAHLRWHALLQQGQPLPDYASRYPIYYAGPADTPAGKVIGSFGPTTAQRMDGYADELMSRGAALVTLAKGNRGPGWTGACKKYGGFYLGTIGGAAALIAEENILESRVIDYEDLGMEAVRLIRVRDLIAFIVTDDKGNDLYAAIAAQARGNER